MFKRSILFLTACLLCAPASAGVDIVATIKPLQLIAGAVSDGVSRPSVLIPAEQSSHHFTLRPSDMRRLTSAELIVRVGPELEYYLDDLMAQLQENDRVLSVSALNGLTRHALGRRALLGGEEHADHDAHEPDSVDRLDPHVWLDTGNAARIAEAVSERLKTMDPANAERYGENLQSFRERLRALETRIGKQLAGLREQPFAVYHDAFQYFEREHGLRHTLAVVADDAMQPGMRQLLRVREALAAQDLRCLLEDVTADADTIRTAIGPHSLERVRADTMGAGLTADATGYIQLMDNLAASFRQCLQR